MCVWFRFWASVWSETLNPQLSTLNLRLQRRNFVINSMQPAGSRMVGDIPPAGVLDLGVGDARGGDGAVVVDVDGAHDAADVEVVLFGADHDHLGAFDV